MVTEQEVPESELEESTLLKDLRNKTMKYKGIELKELTTPQVFDPPKHLLAWDNDTYDPIIDTVYAVIRLENETTEVIASCCRRWLHCAEIPDEPKLRRATYREMSMWLAKGKGELTYEGIESNVYTALTYNIDNPNVEIGSVVKIRKWEDTEWHEPTVDYMGIEHKQVQDTKNTVRYFVTDKCGTQYSVRRTMNGLKVFPTPLSPEKSHEIISLALKQYPELETENK